MLSNTSKYAIRAMIYLALHTPAVKKMGIKQISEELDLPAPFLAKILQALAKNKLLKSNKGPNGGFSLAKDANKITLFEIIRIIDGNDIFDQCLISMRTCHEEGTPCPIHARYEPVRNEIRKLFQEQNLGSLAEDIRSQEKIFAL